MLTKFKIFNYKNFDQSPIEATFTKPLETLGSASINLNFTKSNLNLLFSENFQGKSNFLSALADITINLTDSQVNHENQNYLIPIMSDQPFAEFEYTFKFDGQELIYRYKKLDKREFTGSMTIVEEILTINGEDIVNTKLEKINLAGAETLNYPKNPPIAIIKFIKSNTSLNKEDPNVKIFNQFIQFIDHMLYVNVEDFTKQQGFSSYYKVPAEIITTPHQVKNLENFLNYLDFNVEISRTEIDGEPVIAQHFEKNNSTQKINIKKIGTKAVNDAIELYAILEAQKAPESRLIDTQSLLIIDNLATHLGQNKSQAMLDILGTFPFQTVTITK